MESEDQRPTIEAVDPTSNTRYFYVTEEVLGRGGSAVVYLAQRVKEVARTGGDGEPDPEVTQKSVAIKVTRDLIHQGRLAQEAAILKMFVDRPEAARRLVRIQADGKVLVCPVRGWALLELEYLAGPTLKAWLKERQGREDPPDRRERLRTALRFIGELAEALCVLADVEQGAVIHRDLKPENVMVTSEGLRLFDFNIARQDGSEPKTQYVGTDGYRAPEVMMGEDYSAQADLFSLGLILWELLHDKPLVWSLVKWYPPPYVADWPSAAYADLGPELAEPLARLVRGLLTEPARRFSHPSLALKVIQELQGILAAEDRGLAGDTLPLGALDLIQLLAELRPSGEASVVSDVEDPGPLQRYIRARTRVEDALEAYLWERILAALDGEGGPQLLMLSGNAGDGKSYLIDALLRRLKEERPEAAARVEYIADATHAMRREETQQGRLEAFFAPFAEGGPGPKAPLYIIAMNTGMVIRFFDACAARAASGALERGFDGLYRELKRQLGLSVEPPAPKGALRVVAVNLDLRDLLNGEERASFAEEMLNALAPGLNDGFLAPLLPACAECRAKPLCPVWFNLHALSTEAPRQAVLSLLDRARLDPEVHLSPRNLWGFWYRLVTGGLERYDLPDRAPGEGLCDVVRRKYDARDGRWLLQGHFYQLLFSQRAAGGIWEVIARLDPALSSAPSIDRLQTRLAIRQDLDRDGDILSALGEVDRALAGTDLRTLLSIGNLDPDERRDGAVRRQVMFEPESYAQFRSYSSDEAFQVLLDAYGQFSALEEGQALPREASGPLIQLAQLVREAVLRSYGRRFGERSYLRVSQPNIRSKSQLLVEASGERLDALFNPLKLLVRDPQIRAHRGREALLSRLGYRPVLVTLRVGGYRLMVDRELYAFLLRVKQGQQPSVQELAQFQALQYVAERLGNALVGKGEKARPLFILDGEKGDLYELSRSVFGSVTLTEKVSGKGGEGWA